VTPKKKIKRRAAYFILFRGWKPETIVDCTLENMSASAYSRVSKPPPKNDPRS
jgi:hypothetical protein